MQGSRPFWAGGSSMYKHFVRLARMILLVAAVSVLSGCGDTVTLYYRQIGVCNSYRGTGPNHNAGPNFAYVIAKIEKIDNTRSSIDFHFDAGRLYIRGKNYTDPNAADIVQGTLIPVGDWEFFYGQPALDFFTDMGVPLVTSPIIRAGTQTVLDGYLLFRVTPQIRTVLSKTKPLTSFFDTC